MPPPPPLAAAARALDVDPGALRRQRKPGPPRPVERWRCGDLLFDYASTSEGRRLMKLEVHGRQWAVGIDVPVPPVLLYDQDGSVLVSRWISGSSCGGAEPTAESLRVAERVAHAERPRFGPQASTWRASRASLPLRSARLVAGGLPVRRYMQQRELYAALALKDVAHGDFYRRNVLVSATGDVAVIDWEHLSVQPRWTDHVRLWSTLTDANDRRVVLLHINRSAPAREHSHLAIVVRYLTLRLLGENLAAASRYRDPADLVHARHMVHEGEQLARSMEG